MSTHGGSEMVYDGVVLLCWFGKGLQKCCKIIHGVTEVQ